MMKKEIGPFRKALQDFLVPDLRAIKERLDNQERRLDSQERTSEARHNELLVLLDQMLARVNGMRGAMTSEQDRQDAIAAWEHYQATGLHLTQEEVDEWLVKLEAGEDADPPACHQ
jgi:predicted transcriptional regulator